MVSQLQECQRQMNDALVMCRTAIENNDTTTVSDYSLKIEPEFRDAKQILENRVDKSPEKSSDSFHNNKNAAFSTGFDSDPFKSNGFSSDPFGSSNGMHSSAGFDDSFGGNSGGFGAFENKAKNDPFSSTSAANAFGDAKSPAAHDVCYNKFNIKMNKILIINNLQAGKDEFGCDPFAILHAPTSASQILSPSPNPKSSVTSSMRSESPSRPELPPKKAKQPPPRPAPPRPSAGPTTPKPQSQSGDAFSSGFSSGGFADFADFDNKVKKKVTFYIDNKPNYQ